MVFCTVAARLAMRPQELDPKLHGPWAEEAETQDMIDREAWKAQAAEWLDNLGEGEDGDEDMAGYDPSMQCEAAGLDNGPCVIPNKPV
jgi:hypothetical protein